MLAALKKNLSWVLVGAAGVGFLLTARPSRPDLPDIAPALVVTTLDGGAFDLEAHRGRHVVVNFWATWCGPCRQEMPDFDAFAKAHPEIAVLGLAVDSGSASQVRAFARKAGVDYPLALADSDVVQRYDVEALPTTVVVGPAGEVKLAHVGMMSRGNLERAIR